MKSSIPPLLLLSAGVAISATGGDPVANSLLMCAGMIVLIALAAVLPTDPNGRRTAHVSVFAACIVAFGLIALTHFPFRLSFAASEADLRALAARVRAGETVDLPARAGAFTIHAAGRKPDDSVFLWTDPDPGGPQGFVSRYSGTGYNIWSEMRLGDDWHYLKED